MFHAGLGLLHSQSKGCRIAFLSHFSSQFQCHVLSLALFDQSLEKYGNFLLTNQCQLLFLSSKRYCGLLFLFFFQMGTASKSISGFHMLLRLDAGRCWGWHLLLDHDLQSRLSWFSCWRCSYRGLHFDGLILFKLLSNNPLFGVDCHGHRGLFRRHGRSCLM